MNTVVRVQNTFSDDMVVDAARLSFNDRAENHTPERNAKLIDYLVRNRHVNPFFHGMMSFIMSEKSFSIEEMIQDKSLTAGLNFHKLNEKEWQITTNIWGIFSLLEHLNIKQFEALFDFVSRKCFQSSSSYSKWCPKFDFFPSFSLDEDARLHEAEPPRHHQWFSFVFETDMCTKAQLYTHTVGLAKSSQSYRYIEAEKFYVPDEWRGKAENAKQGSSDEIVEEIPLLFFAPNGKKIPLSSADLTSLGKLWYDTNSHICNEQRRLILPQAQMSKYLITGTREAWERILRLRSTPHAQKEVRDLMDPIEQTLGEEWVG